MKVDELNVHLHKLGKEQQNKAKESRRKERIKIKAEISKIEKDTTEWLNKAESCFLKYSYTIKLDKTLVTVIVKKERRKKYD